MNPSAAGHPAIEVVAWVAGVGIAVVTLLSLVTALAEVLCREGFLAITLLSKLSNRTRFTLKDSICDASPNLRPVRRPSLQPYTAQRRWQDKLESPVFLPTGHVAG